MLFASFGPNLPSIPAGKFSLQVTRTVGLIDILTAPFGDHTLSTFHLSQATPPSSGGSAAAAPRPHTDQGSSNDAFTSQTVLKTNLF